MNARIYVDGVYVGLLDGSSVGVMELFDVRLADGHTHHVTAIVGREAS